MAYGVKTVPSGTFGEDLPRRNWSHLPKRYASQKIVPGESSAMGKLAISWSSVSVAGDMPTISFSPLASLPENGSAKYLPRGRYERHTEKPVEERGSDWLTRSIWRLECRQHSRARAR